MQPYELREYRRLRDEGRWPEANRIREVERRRLRAEGRTRQQARDESWAAMLSAIDPERANRMIQSARMAVEPSASEDGGTR